MKCSVAFASKIAKQRCYERATKKAKLAVICAAMQDNINGVEGLTDGCTAVTGLVKTQRISSVLNWAANLQRLDSFLGKVGCFESPRAPRAPDVATLSWE